MQFLPLMFFTVNCKVTYWEIKLMYKPGILKLIQPVGSLEILRNGTLYDHKMVAMGGVIKGW